VLNDADHCKLYKFINHSILFWSYGYFMLAVVSIRLTTGCICANEWLLLRPEMPTDEKDASQDD
jgi:hypothetical protein